MTKDITHYFYLTPFNNGEHFKFGYSAEQSINTRLKKHNITYSTDLDNTIILGGSYANITTLESIIKKGIPDTISHIYVGKDGYTETRDMGYKDLCLEDIERYKDRFNLKVSSLNEIEIRIKTDNKTYRNQTADVLDFEYTKTIAEELLNNEKGNIPKRRLGLFILIGIYTGIKTKFLMKLKYEDIRGVKYLKQSRNNSKEVIPIPIPSIIQYYLETKFKDNSGSIFVTRERKIISIQHLNVSLKDAFADIVDKKNVSTHTLRKIYGRKIYELNDNSISALVKLQTLFGQASLKDTREYLHINNDTIGDVQLIIEE